MWLRTLQLDLTIVWLGLLAVVARLLAFNVHSSSRIAIDSALYHGCLYLRRGNRNAHGFSC